MTPESNILRDLSAGQTTADSLSPRIGLSPSATEAVLKRLIASGQVEKAAVSVNGTFAFSVYRLTAGYTQPRPAAHEHFQQH